MDMNPFDLIKNMKGIQENMKRMQDILPTITATGSAGAGMVEVTVNGKLIVTSVKISRISSIPTMWRPSRSSSKAPSTMPAPRYRSASRARG